MVSRVIAATEDCRWSSGGVLRIEILTSVLPWAILAVAAPALLLAIGRRSVGPFGLIVALVATIGGLLGAIIWPFLAARVVNPGTVDLIRLCGDAIGREHITDLRVRISTFPPAVLCFPDGWTSAPTVATPTQSIILTVALIAMVALAVAGVISLARTLSRQPITLDAEPDES